MGRQAFSRMIGVGLIVGLTFLAVSCAKSPASLTGPANAANFSQTSLAAQIASDAR